MRVSLWFTWMRGFAVAHLSEFCWMRDFPVVHLSEEFQRGSFEWGVSLKFIWMRGFTEVEWGVSLRFADLDWTGASRAIHILAASLPRRCLKTQHRDLMRQSLFWKGRVVAWPAGENYTELAHIRRCSSVRQNPVTCCSAGTLQPARFWPRQWRTLAHQSAPRRQKIGVTLGVLFLSISTWSLFFFLFFFSVRVFYEQRLTADCSSFVKNNNNNNIACSELELCISLVRPSLAYLEQQ